MKKILIIGGGFGQFPAIEKAREMGLQVVVIDRNPEAIGMKIADFNHVIDVADFEGALTIAKHHEVSGVMTMQSDLPVPTIGYINDNLGLNGVSLQVANYCSNKIETRKRLLDKNCAQPKFKLIKNEEQALSALEYIGLPCVIKAPDSSGSRGIVKVRKLEDLNFAIAEAFKYTQSNEILIEEYIDGLEFGAQTFSEDGVCKLVLLHNDTMSEPPFMIPIGHSFPFKYLSKEEITSAEAAIKEAVLALGIVNGPANVDLILDSKTNTVKIIEIGARIGATCLPELVHYHTGIDWVKETIKNAIGDKVSLVKSRAQPVAALIVDSPEDGIFVDFYNPDQGNPNVKEFEITVKKGDVINKLRKGTDRIGKILTVGDNVLEAERIAAGIKNNIEIILK